jgi:DNA-binding SARP family transcriptional activator
MIGVRSMCRHGPEGGAKALLAEANRPVSADVLLDRAWGEQLPQRARNVLSGYLSRLRRVLGDADGVNLVRQPGGYALRDALRALLDALGVDRIPSPRA